MEKVYSYYELQLKLLRDQLATMPSVDIAAEHVLEKSKKLMAQANKLTNKVSKNLQKYLGSELTEDKEIAELQGILRAYQQLVGNVETLPNTVEELLRFAEKINVEFEEMVQNGEERRSTVFLRNPSGHPMISSHMLQGFVKATLKTLVNAGNKSIFKSKVQVGESMSLDIKILEEFALSSLDIKRKEDGERDLSIRPIRFEILGKATTAITVSEVIPAGAEYKMTLRIRKDSPINKMEILEFIFTHGRNLGLGQGRGSLGTGSFCFKLKELPDFEEKMPEGWQ